MLARPPWTLAIVVGLGLLGCAGDVLTPQSVTSIPDGTAVGSAQSGLYTVELRTVGCEGQCGPVAGRPICELGQREAEQLRVRQLDGSIRMEAPRETLAPLEGGADQDGSFEVGAYAEPRGSGPARLVHARGSINELGELVGTAVVRTTGTMGGEAVDCVAVQELAGARAQRD